MRLRTPDGTEYEGDAFDVVAIGVFYLALVIAVVVLLPFAIAVDIRDALAKIDAVKWEIEP